jgi:hypothetical protein
MLALKLMVVPVEMCVLIGYNRRYPEKNILLQLPHSEIPGKRNVEVHKSSQSASNKPDSSRNDLQCAAYAGI